MGTMRALSYVVAVGFLLIMLATLLAIPSWAQETVASPQLGPIIEDFQGPFEGPAPPRWHPQSNDNPLGFTGDDTITHGGAVSAKWEPETSGRMLYCADVPEDWSAWDGLSMWVHSARPTNSMMAVMVYSNDPATPQWDCYRALVKIDWEGWRLLNLRRRSLAPCYKPVGWNQVTELGFSLKANPPLITLNEGTVLHFADMHALMPEPPGDTLTLFEAGTDCAAMLMDGANVVQCVQDPAREAGGRSGLWPSTLTHKALYNLSVPRDWSQCKALNLWLHCAEPVDERIALYMQSRSPQAPEDDAYIGYIALDWTGWKLVSLPLSDMVKLRDPLGWQQIERFCLYSQSYGATAVKGTTLALDRIWLSKEPPQD
ncbi:hypothetical protein LLH23_12825 [bacterium]|nr:hypothetical protein [bacterium]